VVISFAASQLFVRQLDAIGPRAPAGASLFYLAFVLCLVPALS